MAAHEAKAIVRNADGSEVTAYFETLARFLKCIVQNGDQSVTKIGLDELLNQYADEINETAKALNSKADKCFRVENEVLANIVNFGYIEKEDETLVLFDEFGRVENDTLVLI